MRLENPKQHWKKGTKEYLEYLLRMLHDFIKFGKINHGAFFEQHPKSNIVFFESSHGVERIKLHKVGTLKPKVMKEL
jgi:hypothetical protein